MKNPKVFISHASEDKERFVLEFAKKLRSKGVDAWVDKWEIKPGDSIVEKIFEEGIKNCDVFIIVLSKYSANKKWIKEELNSAVIKRIEGKTRIIPIIIDEDVGVPTSLKHLMWVKVRDLSNYEKEFQQILKTIYEVIDKSPLGEPPKFAIVERKTSDYNKIDELVLKIMGDIILQKGDLSKILTSIEILHKSEEYGITEDEVSESLEILEEKGLIKLTRFPAGWTMIVMSTRGFIKYCEVFLEGWEDIFKRVIAYIVNENIKNDYEISERVGCDRIIVNNLLDYFAERGYLKILKDSRGYARILDITAKGRRYFKNVLK